MNAFTELIKEYLQHCRVRKGLSPKTLRAYGTDLEDFQQYLEKNDLDYLSPLKSAPDSQAKNCQYSGILSLSGLYGQSSGKSFMQAGFVVPASPETAALYSEPHIKHLLSGALCSEKARRYPLSAQMRHP